MDSLSDALGALENEESRTIREKIERWRIKASAEIAEKEYLLSRDGVGFAPRGNVMAIAAEKKAGKSWFAMSLCAALLCGRFLGVESRKPDARCVFFDTEQDEADGQRILRRVHSVCGWPFMEDNDRFTVFHLREMDCEDRRDFVLRAIEHLRPDMAVVDGVRDLLGDFNDIDQSNALVGDLMRVSSATGCAVWCVLHVNPNSEKMRGHLGTELGNKVADILFMTKKKNATEDNDAVYTAEEVAARSHRDIKSVRFRIDDNKPFGLPVLVDEEELAQIDRAERAALADLFRPVVPSPGAAGARKVVEYVKTRQACGTTRAWKFIAQAETAGVIARTETGKYIWTADRKAPELPFENDGEEKAPF